jgi:fructose-1,6-bisphosphatase
MERECPTTSYSTRARNLRDLGGSKAAAQGRKNARYMKVETAEEAQAILDGGVFLDPSGAPGGVALLAAYAVDPLRELVGANGGTAESIPA